MPIRRRTHHRCPARVLGQARASPFRLPPVRRAHILASQFRLRPDVPEGRARPQPARQVEVEAAATVEVHLVPEAGPLVLVAVRAPFLAQVPLPQVAVADVPVAVAPVVPLDVAHRSERVVVVATAKSSSQ